MILSCNNTSISSTNKNLRETDDEDYGEPICIYKKTNKKPSSTYPFNKADKIQVISYLSRKDAYTNDKLIVNDVFIIKSKIDSVELNSSQIDTLFSILYNYRTKRKGNAALGVDCYNPRHSIIFCKENKAIAFLEVCIECDGMRKSPNINFGDFCSDKMCKLQEFFKSIGVKFGVSAEKCNY